MIIADQNIAHRISDRVEYIVLSHINIKVIGIRPMAPVLNTGPLEGI